MSTKEFKLLPIESIEFITGALRTHEFEDDVIIERAADLEINGMDNTPTVAQIDGVYYIKDGATRLKSAMLLQEEGKTIKGVDDGMFPCMVETSDSSTTDILLAQVRGNATIEKTDNKSYVEAIYKIQVEKDLSIAELAKEIGKSEKHTRELLRTVRLPKEVREEIGNDLSFTNAVKLQGVQSKAGNECYGEGKFDELLAAAKAQNSSEFAETIKAFDEGHADAVKAYKESLKDENGGAAPVAEFVFKPKALNKEELLSLRDEVAKGGNVVEIALMEKIFGEDEAARTKAKAAWDAAQEDKKAKADARKQANKSAKDMSDEELEAILKERKANSEA